MMINDEHSNESHDKAKPGSKKFCLIDIIIFLFSGLFLFCFLFNNSSRLRTIASANTCHCQSNLKNISTALEMYSADNSGYLPSSLSQLIPEYLVEIPKCPVPGKDTYSSSYQFYNSIKFKFTMDGKKYYKYSMGTDAYTIFCSGSSHIQFSIGPNYPQYNSRQGLVPK